MSWSELVDYPEFAAELEAKFPGWKFTEEQSTKLFEEMVAKARKKQFPFLSLPEDIRYYFYTMYLVSPRGFVRFFHQNALYRAKVKPTKIGINLLFSCRLIYHEALPVLYKVNNFCIMHFERPIARGVLEHNAQWIHRMPIDGRNNITKLELRIPGPTELPDAIYYGGKPIHHFFYANLSTYFPKLRMLTLFFDKYTIYHTEDAGLQQTIAFYRRLKSLLHDTAEIAFDLTSGNKRGCSIDNIHSLDRQAITHVFSPSRTVEHLRERSSMFVAYERRIAERFNAQDDIANKYLEAKSSIPAVYWQENSGLLFRRWDRAGKIDDDSDDENELFGEWNLEDAVAKKLARHPRLAAFSNARLWTNT